MIVRVQVRSLVSLIEVSDIGAVIQNISIGGHGVDPVGGVEAMVGGDGRGDVCNIAGIVILIIEQLKLVNMCVTIKLK